MIPRKKPSALATILAIILTTVFIGLMFAAAPLLALLVGMTIGYILEVFTGDYVVQAFNAVGFSGVEDGDLPKVFGLLAVAAAFLKMGAINGIKRKDSE